MRQARARVALPQAGIELRPPGDYERVDERRARPEQSPAALGHAIAERAPAARHAVELAHPPGDEDAAPRVPEESSGDHPRRAAMGRMSWRPANGERAAARTAAHARFDDAARSGRRIGESDSCRAHVLAGAGGPLFAHRRRAPHISGHQHDTACRRDCGATLQNQGADENRQ